MLCSAKGDSIFSIGTCVAWDDESLLGSLNVSSSLGGEIKFLGGRVMNSDGGYVTLRLARFSGKALCCAQYNDGVGCRSSGMVWRKGL